MGDHPLLGIDPADLPEPNREPFVWSALTPFFRPEVARQLADEFPVDGFRMAGTRAKLFYVRSLVVEGTLPSTTSTLSSLWREVGGLLASDAYVALLGAIVGRDLTGLRIDATLCRYSPGCSLPPHTDRDIRDTTQVVYFNPEWQATWGGLFRILGSERIDDVRAEVAPLLHTSVVMVRSDCSWHAVTPVVEGVTQERLSLLVHATRVPSTASST